MKLVIDTKSFINAVAWATRSYDSKDDRAYATLHVDADGNGSISHTNFSSYMKSEFTVVSVDFTGDTETEVSFAVDGQYIQRLAGAIPAKGELTISKKLSSSRTSLDVKSDFGKFTIPMLDANVGEEPKTVVIGEVDDNEFFDAMLRISKICDAANTGNASFVSSVDLGFDAENNSVRLFATDRYAMAEVVLGFTPDSNIDDETLESYINNHVLLPHSSAVLVPPTKGLNTSITLIGETSPNGSLRFGYSFPDGRIALFSLMNAPNFTRLETMKTQTKRLIEHSITVPVADLKNAIGTVSKLVREDDDVYLTVSEDGLVVSDRYDTNKLNVEHVDMDYDLEEPYRARFVRPVINEAFSPISTPSVKLEWGSTSGSFVFTPIAEDGSIVETVFVMAVLGTV